MEINSLDFFHLKQLFFNHELISNVKNGKIQRGSLNKESR